MKPRILNEKDFRNMKEGTLLFRSVQDVRYKRPIVKVFVYTFLGITGDHFRVLGHRDKRVDTLSLFLSEHSWFFATAKQAVAFEVKRKVKREQEAYDTLFHELTELRESEYAWRCLGRRVQATN